MAAQKTAGRSAHRPVLRAGSSLFRVAERVGFVPLDLEGILALARARTGLSDFGDDGFRIAAARLLENLIEQPLTALGRGLTSLALQRAAQNRLELQAFLRKHPEIERIPIERPVFIVGLPRTGTTLVQNLLALHPDRRGLETWELMRPVPTLRSNEEDRRHRMQQAGRMLGLAHLLAPDMRPVHAMTSTTLEECWMLFANSFCVLNYDFQAGARRYGAWLTEQHAMRQAYREYKLYLQLLLWQRPARQLVLKCPEHLWFLDDLLAVFPDACLVWTHRDPTEVLASYSSLMSMPRRTLFGRVDPIEIGACLRDRFLEGLGRALSSRDRHGEARFFDLDFAELARNPGQSVRDLCQHFGLPFEQGDAIDRWLGTDRPDRPGAHRYDPNAFGLEPNDVSARFQIYLGRFGPRPRPPAKPANLHSKPQADRTSARYRSSASWSMGRP